MSIFTDQKVTRRSLLLSSCCLVSAFRLLNVLDTPAISRRDYAVSRCLLLRWTYSTIFGRREWK